MFRRLISRYGLAAHLAVLTAAPALFAPFLDDGRLSAVLLWLVLFAAVWLFCEPSVREGESLSMARSRVFGGIVRDPLFYFFAVAAVLAGVRACNSGLALAYNPETVSWTVSEPALAAFPACVSGKGMLPFASVLAAAVVSMGLLHAVGLAGRLFFSLAAAFLVGCAGFAAVAGIDLGWNGFAELASRGFGCPVHAGTVFGIWLVVSVAAGAFCEARGWNFGRLVFAVALGGNAAGLFFLSPPLAACAYVLLALALQMFCFVYLGRAGFIVRNIVFLGLGVAVAAVLAMLFAPDGFMEGRLAMLDPAAAFTEKYELANETLSRIARTMWIKNPWLGVGLGAFGLNVPFFAEKADWQAIPPEVYSTLNGWWLLLVERGIVGCILIASGMVLLLFAYFRRFAAAYARAKGDPEADRLVFACPPVVWTPLFVLAAVCVETIYSPLFLSGVFVFTVTVPMALAAASFPRAAGGK